MNLFASFSLKNVLGQNENCFALILKAQSSNFKFSGACICPHFPLLGIFCVCVCACAFIFINIPNFHFCIDLSEYSIFCEDNLYQQFLFRWLTAAECVRVPESVGFKPPILNHPTCPLPDL